MLDKCKECYEDNKTPDKNSCEQCENNYKRLKQENEKLRSELEEIREILGDNIKLRTKGLEVEIHPEHTFLMEIYNKISEVLK